MKRTPAFYGLMAEFDEPHALVAATKRAYDAGYRKIDAYAPYPVEGLDEALHLRRSFGPWLMLLGGVAGAVGGFALQAWVSAVAYPVNIGGRPLISWPMFVPVTFETTILLTALAGFFGVLVLNRLPQPYHPVFNVPDFALASQEKFFLCIEASDPRFDSVGTKRFLLDMNPQEVHDVPG